MKNQSFFIVMLFAAVAFSSCSKEDQPAPVALTASTQSDQYTETATTVQTAITKTIDANIGGYLEALPAHYGDHPNKKYPLILFLAGQGQLGDGSQTSLQSVDNIAIPKLIANKTFPSNFVVNKDTFQFVVLSPQFKAWPQPSDINDMIDYALANYKVDPKRIYVCGLSMGGGGTWDYGWNFGQRVAAMVPIAGASWPTTQKAQNIAQDTVGVWAFHNNNDPTVPSWYSVDYVNYINGDNPSIPAKLTIFNSTSHDAWTTATNPAYTEKGMNIYQWMLTFKRKKINL